MVNTETSAYSEFFFSQLWLSAFRGARSVLSYAQEVEICCEIANAVIAEVQEKEPVIEDCGDFGYILGYRQAMALLRKRHTEKNHAEKVWHHLPQTDAPSDTQIVVKEERAKLRDALLQLAPVEIIYCIGKSLDLTMKQVGELVDDFNGTYTPESKHYYKFQKVRTKLRRTLEL